MLKRLSLPKSLSINLIASLIIATVAFASQSNAADYVSVIKDGVNVRTGPNLDSPVFMELPKGYPLKVVARDGNWLKVVDFEKDKGWIYSNLVEKGNTVIINGKSTINMRSGPSTKDQIVATVERGVILNRISGKANWVEVSHPNGTKGWIYKTLLWP